MVTVLPQTDFHSRLMPVSYTSDSSLPTCTITCFFNERSKCFAHDYSSKLLLSLYYCLILKTIAICFLLSACKFSDSFASMPQQYPTPPATSLLECHLPPCTAGHIPALKTIHVQLYKLKLCILLDIMQIAEMIS